DSQILVQTPEFKPAREGQTVELRCRVENSKVSDMDLVWEKLGRTHKATNLLIYYRNHDIHRYTSDARFQATRDDFSNSFTLTISNLKLTDFAVYYCFVFRTNIRGTGTELSVARK
uniref:Ig-like domain-containing protein n=1 Tax=Callorhinchus milii TaxID=7868 RepID=A0A4W3JDQ1_CALMI